MYYQDRFNLRLFTFIYQHQLMKGNYSCKIELGEKTEKVEIQTMHG